MAYQVSVFLENKLGKLGEVTAILSAEKINIRTSNLNHTDGGWGILNFIANDPGAAFNALHRKGIPVVLRRIVAMEMSDGPGGLDDLLQKILKVGINFTTAYSRVVGDGKAFFVIDVEDLPQAEERLSLAGIRILSDSVIYGHKSQ